ncbi:TnsA-like heteromeric transposase endonuclease subunit [Arthrobacter sp. JZ12]|uniref:TnsA-like heteromeric transposase endonuclease subunit n=1 Tax=Arthrobacter sp. JZ12 TaxID=2654190 RepID=UPI002B474B39|nr:TnsA-like heteromeric transposase endonuclease subunit [Arthrobacter sp. JZ12]
MDSATSLSSARRKLKAARNLDQLRFIPHPYLAPDEIMLSIRKSRSYWRTFPFRDVTLDAFDGAVPWRRPQYRHGQKNRPGLYWAVTEEAHVPYESLTEHLALLRLDRDPDVVRILAQPFRLFVNERHGKSYVPDFFIVRDDLSVEVVEVKPLDKMNDPKTLATLNWAREIIEPHGWNYELVNEPGQQLGYNLRFLAGYRRSQLLASELLAAVRANTYQPEFFGALEARMAELTGTHAMFIRPHLLHLVWTGELTCDLNKPIDAGVVVSPRGRLEP